MTHYWAIDTGQHTWFAVTNGDDPAAEGIGLGVRHAELARAPAEYEEYDWVTEELVSPDLYSVDENLTGLVDGQRQLLSTQVLPSRSWEYQRKGAEALSTTGPYTYLQAEADARGVDLEVVRASVLAAMQSSEQRLAEIAACAVVAKAAIRDAATAEAKRAAYDSITWPTGE